MTQSVQTLPRASREFPLGLHGITRGRLQDSHANAAVWAPAIPSMDVHWLRSDGTWTSETLVGLDGGVHHGVVGPIEPGSLYAFWPTGQEPPGIIGEAQLLLDPYARAVETVDTETGTDESPVRSYYSVFLEHAFDWGDSERPGTPWRDTVIYEAHVKGLTRLHPEVPEDLRGTYAGLAHPAMVTYLRDLGVTAVELLPVHFHIDEPHLEPLGLSNYWGYNTLGFFAAHTDYATASARAAGPAAVLDEFKSMVRTLHEAGLEVILDVVYNHTAEGEQHRPALCWRGLGDLDYYRHDGAGRYVDTTGCGNTLDFSQPRVVEFALDSLRYWAEECQIDGFRFDLAVTLARDEHNAFTPRHPFLVAAGASKALRGTKLITEPWDIGPDGWKTGRFPVGWADWNDGFRDTLRDFWLRDVAALAGGGRGASPARLAGCLAGSADTFGASGRSALASINLITAHDGFTLADLTAYERKHNEANGEGNRDGHGDNRSYNHGAEGRTEDEGILAARERSARNLMASLLISLGVPMLTAGDEFGRSQGGNNNAYCQDTEVAWVHWPADAASRRMLEATRTLLTIRKDFLAAQPPTFPSRGDQSTLLWFNASGLPMTAHEWDDPHTRTVQLLLGSRGGTINGLVVINGALEDVRVHLPSAWIQQEQGVGSDQPRWFSRTFDSAAAGVFGAPGAGTPDAAGDRLRSGEPDMVAADSVRIYRC
ncbi:glycogen debranching protein GlgX [Arthrobacter agilis]|uniref:glycogen debranching protein GlgX n=1 Tax=Arthrobacter agilis TaxID=37921 RepID=UPI000B350523|nr:glycogen debranching protein GlgX [Arthrobacter agilis]OUM43770.1 glycogen debranching enzyme GlgX [Arthrobacter agilis]PPB46644.1 glycogen debranching enzyme GlgX [Arthrobacter agilis]TPV25013.1 glycogen debranching protein GlgX [Arthrobacter agilis]VDR31194.1 Glycogen debranching enzyme [Arthrobacter agilis]